MKNLLLVFIAISIWPQSGGKGQTDSVVIRKPVADTTLKDVKEVRNNLDTIRALSNSLEKKLTRPRVVYRTKTIVKHEIKKIPVHDTVYIVDTKYIAVPTKDYYEKHIRRENDSIKVAADTVKPKRHKFLYRLFHKR